MWGPLDDVVMGGVSESGFAVVSGAGEHGQPAGIFSGLVSSSNNGGFASVSPACFLLVPSSLNHVEPVQSSHVLVVMVQLLVATLLTPVCVRCIYIMQCILQLLELPNSSCMQEQGICCIIPNAYSCVDLLCQLLIRSCTEVGMACVLAALLYII